MTPKKRGGGSPVPPRNGGGARATGPLCRATCPAVRGAVGKLPTATGRLPVLPRSGWVARATGPFCRGTCPAVWGGCRQVADSHRQVACATQGRLGGVIGVWRYRSAGGRGG